MLRSVLRTKQFLHNVLFCMQDGAWKEKKNKCSKRKKHSKNIDKMTIFFSNKKLKRVLYIIC